MRSLTLAALSLASLPLALALSVAPAPAQDGPALLSPADIGLIFCLARSGNDMAPVEALLTPDLAAIIADAWTRNDAIEAANPGEKPPLGDGIPWASFPDYAPRCTAAEAAIRGDQAFVAIDYGFPDWPEANASDTLVLAAMPDPILQTSRWRIDNIIFDDDYDLRQAVNLSFVDY